MSRKIDNKFHIEVDDLDILIVKTSNGDPIPPDEPLFLLRARDRLALPLLKVYRALSIEDGCNEYQLAGVAAAMEKFERFAREQADKMKQPGITRGL